MANRIQLYFCQKAIFNFMKDRIYQIIEVTCKGSIRKFAEAIGVPYANIYNYYREDRKSSNKVTADIIAKIILSFGEFNADWILTGRGEMLNTSSHFLENDADIKDRLIEVQKELSEVQKEVNEARKETIDAHHERDYYKNLLEEHGISGNYNAKKAESA